MPDCSSARSGDGLSEKLSYAACLSRDLRSCLAAICIDNVLVESVTICNSWLLKVLVRVCEGACESCCSDIRGDATDWASDGYGLGDACFTDEDIPVDDILAAITADPHVSQLLDSLAATPISCSGD